MRLASRIRNDLRRLLRSGANSAQVAAVWNVANFANTDPNLIETYPAPVPQSGTWPALVHYVQPTTSIARQFAEVQVGDAIIDFDAEGGPPPGAKGCKFTIEGNDAVWVQKSVGKDLADAWDIVVEGQRVMKTFLLTRETN